MDIFNERLVEVRKLLGRSEEEVADGIGLTVEEYKKYEKGKKVKLLLLIKFTEYYSISSDYFLGRIEIPLPLITKKNYKVLSTLCLMSKEELDVLAEKLKELK